MPVLVRGPASAPTPSQYQLAAGESFTPEAVTAIFDGSGAAGAFLPCLSIFAQSGELLGRTFPDQLAAGDIGKVTYAPFLRAAAQAAPAGVSFPWVQSGLNGFYNVPSGVSTQFGLDDGDVWGTGVDSGIFSTHADGLGQFGLGIHATGTYALFWGVLFNDTPAAPVANPETFTCEADDGGGANQVMLPFIGSYVNRGYVAPGGRSEWSCSWISTFAIHGDQSASPTVISANQATGVTLRAYTQLLAFQLSTSTFGF